MSTTTRRPPPRQARSEEKRALILKAAERLLTERFPAEVSTKAVAKEAGVPIGSVYRYFANAEAMLRALFDEFNAETVSALMALPAPSEDWRADVSQVFSVIKAMHAQHPAYGPLMAHLGRADETEDSILMLLTERIARTRPDLQDNEAQDIAAMVMGIVEAAERRYHALPQARRGNVFAEGEKATVAYLACYM
ncbi:MAG: helix-turn-helix domain-containing protein [Pseudomonadota bacterium]